MMNAILIGVAVLLSATFGALAFTAELPLALRLIQLAAALALAASAIMVITRTRPLPKDWHHD